MRCLCFFTWIVVASAQDIVGMVVDEVSGLPVPAAAIRLHPDGMPGGQMPPSWINATSGGDGKFVFPKVAVGKYSLDCSKLGYLTEERSFRGPSVEVKADGSVEPVLVKVRMMPEAVLSGRLLTEDGKPIAGVNMRSSNSSTQTNETGAFELTGLRACVRDCKVRVTINDELRRASLVKDGTRTLGLPDWIDKTLDPWIAGQQLRNLELRIANEPLVSFSGIVGNAPKNSTIELAREGSYPAMLRKPSKDGAFAFDLLPSGKYRVLVFRPMDHRPYGEIAVRIDSDLNNQQLMLPKMVSITGVAQLNGKPFYQPGYKVTLSQQSEGIYRGAQGDLREDGTFEVTGLSAGKWLASLSYTARTPDQMRNMKVRTKRLNYIEIVNGDNAPVTLELVETVTVGGRILDAEGLPVSGSVMLKSAGVTMICPSDRLGNFECGVLPDTYQATAWRTGDGANYQNPPLCAAGKPMTITADMPKLEVRVCR